MKPIYFFQKNQQEKIVFSVTVQGGKFGIEIQKIIRQFWKEKTTTGYIDLTGSQYREAEGHLKLRSCLQYVVINYALRIGKCINKI